MTLIVKREGHKEAYDERKVYGSCYASVLNTHKSKEDAEDTCGAVVAVLAERIAKKKEITSKEIFHHMCEIMERYDKDAAFMYKTHKDLS
ncbi:MAG: hypothetical protein AAB343_01480 [Patescibacteria group bacterium]